MTVIAIVLLILAFGWVGVIMALCIALFGWPGVILAILVLIFFGKKKEEQ